MEGRAIQSIKRWENILHQARAMLRDTKEEESVEESLVGREETIAIVVGPEGDRGPSSPIEMEILDGMGHLGLEESLDDDMNFYIRRLIMEDDASKGINNLPP